MSMRGRVRALALAACLGAALLPSSAQAVQSPEATGSAAAPAATAPAATAPAATAPAAAAPRSQAPNPGASLSEGERLFRANRPAEALPYLEKAVKENPGEAKAWIWLGMVHDMLGRPDETVNVLRRGLSQAGDLGYLFYFNMGNAYFRQGKASFAEEMHGQAIAQNPSFAPAFLNRGNDRLIVGDARGAAADFRRYLELEPGSPQKTNIEEVIRLIGGDMAEEDRKAAEAEARRLAAEAARQALLDEVAASLKAAAEETTSLSAGSGAVQGYGDEFTLDE